MSPNRISRGPDYMMTDTVAESEAIRHDPSVSITG